MKVLVTGGSGFIGSHLIRKLINSSHDVMVLAMPNDNLWRIKDCIPHIKVIRGTLHDMQKIIKNISPWIPNGCIHLAWYAEPVNYLHASENLESLNGSLELIRVLSDNGCEHFIGAGTCAEYEMKEEVLVETDKTIPDTLYSASKLSFQMMGKQLAILSKMRFTWGRIFFLYGDKENPRRLVPAAIQKLLRGEVFQSSPGEQIRDYLHVEDVANAFLVLMEKQIEGIFNICSAEPITIKNLLNLIGDLTGQPELIKSGALPYRDWEPMAIYGKNDRLKSTGWLPRKNLETGLQETINWWKYHTEMKNENSN